jgi:hypothetical protein
VDGEVAVGVVDEPVTEAGHDAGLAAADAQADDDGLPGGLVPLEVALGVHAEPVHFVIDAADAARGDLPRGAALRFEFDERPAVRALAADVGEVAALVDVAVVGVAEVLATAA